MKKARGSRLNAARLRSLPLLALRSAITRSVESKVTRVRWGFFHPRRILERDSPRVPGYPYFGLRIAGRLHDAASSQTPYTPDVGPDGDRQRLPSVSRRRGSAGRLPKSLLRKNTDQPSVGPGRTRALSAKHETVPARINCAFVASTSREPPTSLRCTRHEAGMRRGAREKRNPDGRLEARSSQERALGTESPEGRHRTPGSPGGQR
jgi:hypothetical protein